MVEVNGEGVEALFSIADLSLDDHRIADIPAVATHGKARRSEVAGGIVGITWAGCVDRSQHLSHAE